MMRPARPNQGGHARDPLVRPSPGRRGDGPARRRTAGLLRRRDQLARLGPVDARRVARTGRARRLLDLHVRQLAADAPVPRARGPRSIAQAGLTVVGVHTPEFGFERDLDNVIPRTRALGVEYPVAVDSDYGVWRAFGNHFWPAIYLADAEGRIRYHHFGEGEYAMTEMVIQQLLTDAGAKDVDPGLVDVDPQGLEVAADWRTLRSPETYVGYGQATGFASGGRGRLRRAAVRTRRPRRLPLNHWDLTGHVDGRAATPGSCDEPGGRIAFQFQARDVNLVMGPATRGTLRSRSGSSSTGGRRPTRRGTDVAGDGSRDRRRAAHVPAHPPAGRDRRAPVRDRVPRGRRRGLLLHVRLNGEGQRRRGWRSVTS